MCLRPHPFHLHHCQPLHLANYPLFFFLHLNSSKTEVIQIGTSHQIQQQKNLRITFSGQMISLSSMVTDLGVIFDPQLTFKSHIKHICKIFKIQNLSTCKILQKLQPLLSLSDAERLVHAFVSSRLDYCYALLIGIPGKNIQRLQYVQNCAARVLMRVRKHEHITPVLQSLHWLPVSAQINCKISLLTFHCLHGDASSYLKDHLNLHCPSRSLRSSNTNLLHIPRTHSRTMGDRAFFCAAPRLWNTLPPHLRAPQIVEHFKTGLKTILFTQFF